jgi:hypothetical protein
VSAGGTLVRGRALTWLAVGFLCLDGLLLLLAGLWAGRAGLLAGGAACLGCAAGVLWLWRRQQRALADVRQARVALQQEAREIRELLRREP